METQKGLTGVSMPNFKGVGRDLAKDMNVEPEPEPEPEETEFESGLSEKSGAPRMLI